MTICPHLRGDPDATQWCALAEREHETLERIRDNYDRILALTWELEALTDRMAAVCPDPVVIDEFEVWKRRRNP